MRVLKSLREEETPTVKTAPLPQLVEVRRVSAQERPWRSHCIIVLRELKGFDGFCWKEVVDSLLVKLHFLVGLPAGELLDVMERTEERWLSLRQLLFILRGYHQIVERGLFAASQVSDIVSKLRRLDFLGREGDILLLLVPGGEGSLFKVLDLVDEVFDGGDVFRGGVLVVVDAVVDDLLFYLEGVRHLLAQGLPTVLVLAGLYHLIHYRNLQLFVPFQLALYRPVYAFQPSPQDGVQFVLHAVLRSGLGNEYLPGRLREISAQRLPMVLWRRTSSASSYQFQSRLLMALSRWLWYLYRHCLPFLPDIPNCVFIAFAIYDHFRIFPSSCSLFSTLSSLLNPEVLPQSTPFVPSIITNNKTTLNIQKPIRKQLWPREYKAIW